MRTTDKPVDRRREDAPATSPSAGAPTTSSGENGRASLDPDAPAPSPHTCCGSDSPVPTGSPDSPGAPATASLAADLEALEQIVDRIAAADITAERLSYSGPVLGQAAVQVHRLTHRLWAKRLQWLMAEEADGRWALSGARTYATHMARTHHITHSGAKAEVRLARQLRDHLPRFEAALRAGHIGADQARIMAREALTSSARIDALQEAIHTGDAKTQGEDDADTEEGAGEDFGADAGDSEPGNDAGGVCTVEEFMLAKARGLRPEQLRYLVRHYATLADPEADERGYRKAQEREHFELSPTLGGYHLGGFLTNEHGQQLATALAAVMGKPARTDKRTATQRRAQGLADMARLILDQGLGGTTASVRPHLGVLVGFEEFRTILDHAATNEHPGTGNQSPSNHHRPGAEAGTPGHHTGPAGGLSGQVRADFAGLDWARLLNGPLPRWTDATGPVPMAVLRRMASCADVYRVIFGPDNQIINHGRAHRVFTPAQRRAIIARDRHCVFPNCNAPPVLCETHHTRPWARGGSTDITNGALLCFHHHDLVETHHLDMTHTNSQWHVHKPNGTPWHPTTPWKQRE